MRALQTAGVAGVIASLLYWRLDSGLVMAERAPRLVSLPLGGLAVLFALGAWAATFKGQPRRAPFFAGLALGVGAYAVLRPVLF